MRKHLCAMTAVLLLFMSLLGITGVWAQWQYAGSPPQPVIDTLSNITLREFIWDMEEILPDLPEIGSSHLALVRDIMNNEKNGLNSRKEAVEDAVNLHKLLHSYETIQGGNLKHLFETEQTRALEFVLEYVTDAEYHVYTYDDSSRDSATLNQTEIAVYKTILVETDGVWDSYGSMYGRAKVTQMDGRRVIDISTWTEGATAHSLP